MSDSRDEIAEGWADEIRQYLLGRLSTTVVVGPLPQPERESLRHAPIRQWWTLEGKQYATLGGPFAPNVSKAVRLARQLDSTFNPRIRRSERPEGDVDWPSTFAQGPRIRPEYVVRSSGTGLNEAERAALRGWAEWIHDEWVEYFKDDAAPPAIWPRANAARVLSPEQLRRWALIARRSRWPFLREVVAETLRPLFEASDIDLIPLPSNRADLFELLCLVRIARRLGRLGRGIRWLDRESTSNTVAWENLTCWYQCGIDRAGILQAPGFSGPLAVAIEELGVNVPERADLVFEFQTSTSGFDGLIVEAKSGDQDYDATVEQLRAYRAGWDGPGSRYVIWGIVERTASRFEEARFARVLQRCAATEDLWVFSTADDIDIVLHAVFGSLVEEVGRVSGCENLAHHSSQQHGELLGS
jgi:hypothetical protein